MKHITALVLAIIFFLVTAPAIQADSLTPTIRKQAENTYSISVTLEKGAYIATYYPVNNTFATVDAALDAIATLCKFIDPSVEITRNAVIKRRFDTVEAYPAAKEAAAVIK